MNWFLICETLLYQLVFQKKGRSNMYYQMTKFEEGGEWVKIYGVLIRSMNKFSRYHRTKLDHFFFFFGGGGSWTSSKFRFPMIILYHASLAHWT